MVGWMGYRCCGLGKIVVVQVGGVDCRVVWVDPLWEWLGSGGWVGVIECCELEGF